MITCEGCKNPIKVNDVYYIKIIPNDQPEVYCELCNDGDY